MGRTGGAKGFLHDLTASRDCRRAIREIRWLERRLRTARLRAAVPFAFVGRGHFRSMKPMQTAAEIERLFEVVSDLRPKRVLEVGTARGGTLYLWLQAAAVDATIASIDLPGGEFGGGYPECRESFYGSFARRGQTLRLLREDSHRAETVTRVREIFDGQAIDFLFVDADHTYAGVKTDFVLYGPLVRPGGLIAMHDIRPSADPQTQVDRLWRQLRIRFETEEIVHPDEGGRELGIGVVRVPDRGVDAAIALE